MKVTLTLGKDIPEPVEYGASTSQCTIGNRKYYYEGAVYVIFEGKSSDFKLVTEAIQTLLDQKVEIY